MLKSSDWLDVAAGRPVPSRTLDEVDLETAVHHGLVGLLAHSANPIVRETIRPVYARFASRQHVMKRHLRLLLRALSEAGVRATVVKGPALAEWAYRMPEMRTYTDIDLLVPPADLSKALDVLESFPGINWIPPKRPKADKREVLVNDEATGISFSVDLHWDLFSYAQLGGTAVGATNWAWEHAQNVPDHPLGPMQVLPEVVRLAFLGTHAALDHRFRLILFRDLAEVAKRGPNWGELHEFAAHWHLRSFVYASLLLARRWADAPVPDGVLAGLRVPSGPQRVIERLAPLIDPVAFEGHRPHPLNLAFVTLHDRPLHRVRLVLRAPAAVPHWWRRVSSEHVAARALMSSSRRSALVVLTSNRRRGAEVFGTQLAEGLSTRGWAVQSVSLSSDASGATVDADPLVNRPLAELGRLSQEVVRELRRRIRQLHPDVVLANGSATLKYTAAAVAGMRNPPAFVYASIGEPSYWAQGTSRRLAQRLLLSRVDLIAAVSAATAHQLVAEFGVRDSKTVVAYTGVPERFLTVDRVQRSIDELRILMIGALTKEKQPHLGVRVLAELRKTQAARLRLVGAGNLTDMVAAEARSQGVEPETELVGSVDDIGPHLEWADVLLLTSSTEGLPGVVLEAAAVGVPSVAFDVGGTREAIVNGVTGYVIDPQDVAAAARCLADLAEQSRKLIGLGAAARERIRNEFTMSHAIDRYSDLLEQAGAVRPRRRIR